MFGSGAAPDAYAIGGASPELVAAFLTAADGTTPGEYFRTGGVTDDFSMFTFARSDNATMFDSTGTLVWGPHNTIPYSNDFSNVLGWYKSRVAVSAGPDGPDGEANSASTITVEDAGGSPERCEIASPIFSVAVGVENTFKIAVKRTNNDWIFFRNDGFTTPANGFSYFDLATPAVGTVASGFSATISSLADDWLLITFTFTADASDTNGRFWAGPASANGNYNVARDGVISLAVFGAHAYRSDLGGMADNPDQPAGLEKYVPTTSAAVYLSRRNAYYYNSGWTKGGLQLEPAAATNQAPYSNDFSQWTASGAGVAVTASASNGPLGASTMSKVEAAGGSAPHYIRDLFSITTGNNTFAYWVKSAGEGVHPQIRATGQGGGFAFVNFDIDNGTVGNSGGSGFVNADIFDFGGGVYLIYGVINHTASGDGALLAMCETPATDGELPTFNNNGAGFYVSGAQVEAGSIPTSHIPTSGSTVPRAAETLSVAGADTPANTTAMSISMKGLMTYADEGAAAQETFLRWYADANNFITLDLDTDSTATGEVNANQSTAGTLDTVVAAAEYSPGVNVAFNIASRHTSGAINVAKDGTAATADTTPTALVDLSSTALTPGYDFNGFISELRIFGTDIGDSGIAEVTS